MLAEMPLRVAGRAAASKSPIPAMEGLLIEAGHNVRVTGYDLKKGIYTTFEADVSAPGSVVINAKLFGDIVRKLGTCRLFAVAAPDYLARHGRPAHPAELKHHECLNYTLDAGNSTWWFQVAGRPELVAVRSPRFGEVSLHETRMVDGVSRMRGIERLPVAAGGEALMQPGGLHLMLMQPDATLVEGERVPLVLVLADGSEVPATLAVRKAAP